MNPNCEEINSVTLESAERLGMPQVCFGCLRYKTDCPVQGTVAKYATSCIHRIT
jgi:hypothetical protein